MYVCHCTGLHILSKPSDRTAPAPRLIQTGTATLKLYVNIHSRPPYTTYDVTKFIFLHTRACWTLMNINPTENIIIRETVESLILGLRRTDRHTEVWADVVITDTTADSTGTYLACFFSYWRYIPLW